MPSSILNLYNRLSAALLVFGVFYFLTTIFRDFLESIQNENLEVALNFFTIL